MIAHKKMDSKTFAQQKRTRRRLITFFRVIRYGTDNFVRNSWLSVAATAVMTVTLLIMFTVFATHNILSDTVSDLSNKVDMSIYLQTDTTDQVGSDLSAELRKLSSVRSVTYINAGEARAQIAQENSNDPAVLAAINEATNENPATLRVVVKDIDNTTQLQNFVNTDSLLKKHISSDFKPSFAGERRNTIKSIGRAVNFIQQLGIIIGVVFVIISSLIIFNTIRMAIFNRREEIEMEKLIGADKSFIRGPFLVESIIYGIIAAVIATGLGIWGLHSVSGTLESYQVSVHSTIHMATYYSPLVLLCMVLAGALIGVISSLFATHRYLKL
jgi:cell division transport system permease protein